MVNMGKMLLRKVCETAGCTYEMGSEDFGLF